MERLLMMDCGDGVRRADNGAFGKGARASTGDYRIRHTEAGTMFSNRGATGLVVFYLPAPKANMWFGFAKPTQQDLIVQATGGARIAGGQPDKKYKNLAPDVGGSCWLIADNYDWFVLGEHGNWQNDNV